MSEENTITEAEYDAIRAEAKAYLKGEPVEVKETNEDPGTKTEESLSKPEQDLEIVQPVETTPAETPQDPKAFLANLPEDQRNALSAYLDKQEAEAKKYKHSAQSNIARYSHATRREQELSRKLQELEAKLTTSKPRELPQSLQKLAEEDAPYAQAIQDALEQQRAEYEERLNRILETEVRPIHQARQEESTNNEISILEHNAPDWKETLFAIDDRGLPLQAQDGSMVYNEKFVEFVNTLHPTVAQVMINPQNAQDALWAYGAFKDWSGQSKVTAPTVDPKVQALAAKREQDLKTLPVNAKAPVAASHKTNTITSEEEFRRMSQLARKAIASGNTKIYK